MRNSLFSPAKINLGLSVVGRREDGFHLLESLFWPVSFGDFLEIETGQGRVLLNWATSAPFPGTKLPEEKENIVTKALKALPELGNRINVRIDKNIPLGGGLGGGSSNIGTVLRHLKAENSINISDLAAWSSQFGADVPFFLASQPAWVTGIGEKVLPLTFEENSFKPLYFLLVLFPFGCETKLIFSEYKKSGIPFSASTNPFSQGKLTLDQLTRHLKTAKNDLEPVVSKLYPDISRILEKLRQVDCLYAGLSGSGATCFAIFESPQQIKKTAKELEPFFRKNNCKSISAETFATR